MWRNAWVWGLSVGLAASVLGASLVLAQDTPPRLRGTLDQVNGNALAIKARNGTSSTVQLKGDAPIVAVETGAMSDIKDNSFAGSRQWRSRMAQSRPLRCMFSQNRCGEPAKDTILGT